MNEFRILCRASSAKSSIIFARFLLLLLYIGTQKVPTEQEPFICTFNFQPWQDQQEYKDKFIERCGKYIFIIILCISWSFVRNLVWIYSSMFLFLSFLIGLLTADVAVHFISFICVVNFVGNIVYLKVWYYIYLGICRGANRD